MQFRLQDAGGGDATSPDGTFSGNAADSLGTDLVNALISFAPWSELVLKAVTILLVVLAVWLALKVIDRATGRWERRFEQLPKIDPHRQRVLTTSKLFRSAARYIGWPLAAIMVLSELNVDVAAIIATAGIAGIALGFGAQTLVRDLISGVLLLFDDSIHVGDLIRVGTDDATVEEIGVRLIKARRFNGELLMIPAGELRIFGNRSVGYARAIVEVGLAYEQDVDTILPVMKQVASAWVAENKTIVLQDEPDIQAITTFGDSSVTARIAVQVNPGEQFQAERALRLSLKREFDLKGIEIPFPRRTVFVHNAKDD